MDGGRLPGHSRRRVLRKPKTIRAGDSHAARRHDKGRHAARRRPPRHRAADNKDNARRPEPPVCRNRRHADIHAWHTTRQRTLLRRACLRRLPHSAAHAPRHRKGAGKTTRRRPAEHPQLCGYERSR